MLKDIREREIKIVWRMYRVCVNFLAEQELGGNRRRETLVKATKSGHGKRS